jgi:hypothetical protein
MESADLLKAILGLVTGAVGTYFGLYWKIRKELVAQYDRDLRTERVKHYKDLWAATELLAKYSPPEPITKQGLEQLAATLRHWYFSGGGIFLSDRARDAYFAFQDSIVAALAKIGKQADEMQLTADDLKPVRKASSRLRTILTGDIGSRNRPLLERSSGAKPHARDPPQLGG